MSIIETGRAIVQRGESYDAQVEHVRDSLATRRISRLAIVGPDTDSEVLATALMPDEVTLHKTYAEVLEAAAMPGTAGILPTQSQQEGMIMHDKTGRNNVAAVLGSQCRALASMRVPFEGNPTTMAIVIARTT